nr:MAG TPA: hypothetical protein [Bacteriophage sp.]
MRLQFLIEKAVAPPQNYRQSNHHYSQNRKKWQQKYYTISLESLQ